MATPAPKDFAVTKQMYEAARKAYGICSTCREKLRIFDALGYQYPDISSQLDEWEPKAMAVMQAYTDQLGNGQKE